MTCRVSRIDRDAFSVTGGFGGEDRSTNVAGRDDKFKWDLYFRPPLLDTEEAEAAGEFPPLVFDSFNLSSINQTN